MKWLVTGATGLIGRAAVAALVARGHAVVAASRSASKFFDGKQNPGVQVLDLDLSQPFARLPGLDTNEPIGLLALAPRLRHVVYASSCTVYGWPLQLPVDEDAPLQPWNAYAMVAPASPCRRTLRSRPRPCGRAHIGADDLGRGVEASIRQSSFRLRLWRPQARHCRNPGRPGREPNPRTYRPADDGGRLRCNLRACRLSVALPAAGDSIGAAAHMTPAGLRRRGVVIALKLDESRRGPRCCHGTGRPARRKTGHFPVDPTPLWG
ncbi:MAG: NAD-dependent epimerase/dehydratase family protein [Myxococcales bacterium]|nr:NAD-dependent epimerase/dehydratase family protein [Myxococcales bacterium]